MSKFHASLRTKPFNYNIAAYFSQVGGAALIGGSTFWMAQQSSISAPEIGLLSISYAAGITAIQRLSHAFFKAADCPDKSQINVAKNFKEGNPLDVILIGTAAFAGVVVGDFIQDAKVKIASYHQEQTKISKRPVLDPDTKIVKVITAREEYCSPVFRDVIGVRHNGQDMQLRCR